MRHQPMFCQAFNTFARMEADGAQKNLLISYLLMTGYMLALEESEIEVPTDDEVAVFIEVLGELLVDWTQENPDGTIPPANFKMRT